MNLDGAGDSSLVAPRDEAGPGYRGPTEGETPQGPRRRPTESEGRREVAFVVNGRNGLKRRSQPVEQAPVALGLPASPLASVADVGEDEVGVRVMEAE
jgi:hypothetical protein